VQLRGTSPYFIIGQLLDEAPFMGTAGYAYFRFNQAVDTAQSIGTTGAMRVDGGIVTKKNAWIGGAMRIDGAVALTGNISSTTTTTGTVVVTGGLGVSECIRAGSRIHSVTMSCSSAPTYDTDVMRKIDMSAYLVPHRQTVLVNLIGTGLTFTSFALDFCRIGDMITLATSSSGTNTATGTDSYLLTPIDAIPANFRPYYGVLFFVYASHTLIPSATCQATISSENRLVITFPQAWNSGDEVHIFANSCTYVAANAWV
jgi:hypothetical protein